jgi:hypothetical protein
MGGGSGSQTSTSTYSPPPEVAAAYKQLLQNAQPLFTAPYQPYTAGKATTAAETVPLTVAPQTPNQVAAGQNIAGLAGYYQPYANAATDMIQQGSQPIQLQQFNNQSVGQYMSPYMKNVMGSTIANINETNAQQQQQVLGNTISKGAYGGDRGGIAQAELARQQNLANNATLANVANTGYNSALGQFNAMNQLGMNAQSLSNQYAQQGASALANLGTMGQNAALQQAAAQYGVGSNQQQQKQAELSTAYQNYLNQIGYPYQQAQFEGGLISGVASGMGGTNSSTATPAQPGGLNQVIGGLGALGSLGSLFGGGGGAGAAGAGGFGGMMSGLGSGIASFGSGMAEGLSSVMAAIPFISDERAKENIHLVGKTFDGQNIYKFNYKGDPATQIGLMAQEVEHHHPAAVGEWHGLKTVNYDAATKSAEHRGHFAVGGDVQKQQGLLGVSPIAGMTASSYLPTGPMAMANPKMPQTPAPAGKNPNDLSKDQLADAVKGIRTLMGKPDPNSKPDAKPATAGVAPVAANSPPPPTAGMAPAPQEPVTPIQEEASGGRIHHYGVGGVADTTASAGSATATAQKPNSFDALRASQQHYTQALPNAGVVPSTTQQLPSNVGNADNIGVDKLKNPASAYSSYNRLANSGHASLADLQSAYDLYSRAQAPAEPITQVQMGAPAKPKAEVAPETSYDGYDRSGGDGGGGGLASGGRIQPHHFGSGGGIINYSGLPTKKSVQEGAESVIGSGATYDPTLASIASQDYLPEQAARGGVIGREHHANPDETNDYSNVAGKTAGVAAVAPEEGVATGVSRKNYGNFHPEFATRFEQFVKRANEEGIPIKPGSGFRDANEQAAIYADKQAGNRGSIQHLPVAPPYASGHQYGLASDFSGAKPSDYGRLGEIATETGLNYGGKFGDPIHVQYGPNSFSELRQYAYDESGKFKPGFALPQDWADRSKEAANAPYPAGLVGAKSSGVVQGSAPQGQSQGQEQPRQGPMQLNQTATKEGLSGMLGISMTDNQRLAAFNAFARMAGTPGKFGMGLAAAADTYSKTLMEANKQQREGYTAESEAKLRSAEEAKSRVSRQGSVTQVNTLGPDGKINVENQYIPMGGSATFGGGQQPSVVSGGTSPTGAPSGPTAPMSPESTQKINLLGPVSTADADKNGGSSKFSVIDELAKQAREANAYRNPETVAAEFDKEYRDIQGAANNASASRADLTSTIKAVSETAPGGLSGFGPYADQRAMFNRVANLGLNSFGIPGFNVEGLSNNQILDKAKEISAQNTANSNAAARWLETLAKTYPNNSLDEGAAKKLTAGLIVQSQRALDYQAVANEYGNKSMKMGTNIAGVFDQVNSPNMYAAAQNDIYKLMMRSKDITTPDGKTVRGNPISAYMNGTGTPEQFDAWARQNGSTIANLSRFIPRQTVQ